MGAAIFAVWSVVADRRAHLSAARICRHQRFHTCSCRLLTCRLVRFMNCLSDPQDMYSVIQQTCKYEALESHLSADNICVHQRFHA